MLKKLHRLTERKRGVPDAVWKDVTYPCHNTKYCPKGDCTDPNACDYSRMLERLAAYEDTRLTPEDVLKLKTKAKRMDARIREYRQLIEKLEASGVKIPPD